MKTILLAGCGNMGFAMLQGWLAKGAAEASNIAVVEPNEALRDRAAATGAAVGDAPSAFAGQQFDIVLVALKPQILSEALPAYKPYTDQGAAVLTVAAGAPIALYQRIFGADTPVIRTIPNTPAAVGAGMTGLYASPNVSKAAKDFAMRLLEANGVVDELSNEAMIDVATAVSGSGPAYVFHFIEALAGAAEAAGMSKDQAMIYARQTVIGAARLAEHSSEDAGQLRRNVTSPKGTTYAALQVMMGPDLAEGGPMEQLITKAVAAAKARAEELGRG
jgi:pyrroline-5-carboxylate reductase